jgi:uncharacterized protein YbjQ (UPF0145 family)
VSEPPDIVGDDEASERSAALLAAGALPAQAQDRIARMRRDHSYTSDLSTGEFAAIHAVGFDPVGQVLGTCVYQIGWTGAQCGLWNYGYGGGRYGGGGYGPGSGPGYGGGYGRPRMGGFGPMIGPGGPGGFAGPLSMGPAGGVQGGASSAVAGPLERALKEARRLATDRLLEECRGLGGDGVVGVRLTLAPFPGTIDTIEFQAIGTAIRGRAKARARSPFLSDLSGQDFAKLLLSGWVPCGFAFGVAAVVRHDDWATRAARSSMNRQNTEIPGYTALVQETRERARHSLSEEVTKAGGEGVVISDMNIRIGEQECRLVEGGHDHYAESTVFGTVIARFKRRAAQRSATLPMLRLSERRTPAPSG